jgi:long-chain acyl-CoA synthetase
MKPATLIAAWDRTVRKDRDAAALIEAASGKTWSRGEIDMQADAWVHAHGEGLAGHVVLLAEPNGPEWLRVALGILKAGAVLAPIDPGEPPAARAAIAADLGAALIWSGGQPERRDLSPVRARKARRLIKLTSGSTGRPRALAFDDAQMLADGRQICATMRVAATDVNYALIPFGHSYGLGNLILPLLLQGTAIVFGAAALPHAIATEIDRWRATVFPAVPALLRALADSEIEPARLASLRTVISAGAPLTSEVAKKFHEKFGRKIHSFYGSSETGGITYDRTGDAALTGRSVGRPLRGVTLRMRRGNAFTVESAAVTGVGRFRPADRGRLNERGELVLLGRAGRFAKIGGRRLELGEVEHALRQLNGVADAFVAVHAQRGEALVAAVISVRPTAELRTELRERLASWKVPRRVVALPEFPLTPRGKTDTRRLGALLAAEA